MIKVALLTKEARLPTRSTPLSAGLDLYSSCMKIIWPNSIEIIETGIKVALTPDVYGRIAPRSGVSLRSISVGGGVIDSDYVGEVKVILCNHHQSRPFYIAIGDRIAQLILEKIALYDVVEAQPDDLIFHGNRLEGFGSSGK